MNTPSELPPELQEVETALQTALIKGGIEACKTLVNGLAVEAETGQIILDGADDAILYIEEQIDTFPEIQGAAAPRIKDLRGLSISGQLAVVRHTYATMRLHQIQCSI